MDLLEKYAYTPDEADVNARIEDLKSRLDAFSTPEVYRNCFSMMDLTTLKSNDTPSSVKAFVERLQAFTGAFPAWPLPASVCVYPNFAGVASAARGTLPFHVTTVAGCFPSSQSFLSVKEAEVRQAVRDGADEIDIVLALNAFLDGDWDRAGAEIACLRKAVDEEGAAAGRPITLKVILETGLLGSVESIARASFLAMENGADFIKTSTGKVEVNATPQAAWVMCSCIAAYARRTGRKVGFKPAGGMSVAADAVLYYAIAATLLGEEWLNAGRLRFGVSRLANHLLSAALSKPVSFF